MERRRTLRAAAALVMTLLALGTLACGSADVSTSEKVTEVPADSGRAGSESGSPEREEQQLVVLAPGAAEMVARLGAAEQVVGIGDFVHWPPELMSKPRVGAYDTPNAEVILSLGADLLITSTSQAARSGLRRLKELGIDVLELDTESFDEIVEAYRILGGRLGKQREAAALIDDLERRQAVVRARVAGMEPRRVLVVVGRDPLFVAGPGSHLDRMIRDAGGVNVASDVGAAYRQMSREAMLERLPEVVVDTSDNRPGAPRGRELGSWAQWDFLPAVQQGRVYHVHPDRLVIPGPRLPEMTELMARLIHPEVFGEATPEQFGPLLEAEDVEGGPR